MAIKTDGVDLLLGDLEKLAKAAGGDLPDKMLDAGAETAENNWREGIQTSGHIDTGEMLASIGTVKGRSAKSLTRSIYPQGKDSKGVRNATKAYILNYGTSKRKGDHFVDKLNRKSETDVYKVMVAVFDEETKL